MVQKTDEIKKYLGIVHLVTQDLCVYIWLVMALFNIFQKCIAQIYRICTSRRKKRRTSWRPVHKFYSSRVKGGTENDPRSRRRHKTQMEFQHPLCQVQREKQQYWMEGGLITRASGNHWTQTVTSGTLIPRANWKQPHLS